MKKPLRLLCLFAAVLSACLCVLCACCDPVPYGVDREELNKVVRVELVEYTNDKQKHFVSWVPDQFDKLIPFETGNAAVIETLPQDKISDFSDVFVKKSIMHTYYAYNSPKDVCLRLVYENDDFLIVWANYKQQSYSGYIGKYSADGKVLEFWGCFYSLGSYIDLVNDFFDYKLPDYRQSSEQS